MSDQSHPVIIEVAINGVTSREQNPRVPITPEEVARDALACIEAGAAVVHNHTTVFGQGAEASADAYLAGWAAVLAARPDALIYPTVDYDDNGVSYEHLAVLASRGGLRIGICDPGSINLGGMGERGPEGIVYANSYEVIGRALDIHAQHRLGPSFAIYEPGFLRTVLAFRNKGRVPDGAMLKFYFSTEHGLFGAPFGMPPTIKALEIYLDILGDCPIPWAVSVVGGDAGRSEVAAAALERGGHLHVGLEFFHGDRQPSNVELVREAVALCQGSGRPVATPSQAAEILGLP
ncbi:3-keto-5-aminohexanoate cleavage protein [Haliea sp. E1-2-M8]|uniref:3-keto-5-aminohexanoate cleavage protein n=1 Tax=Haliea sp. E1-2-M8 TaxID=3064706 RepID=UPI0027223393|nr:3-keto-5-aminohexanoate cleavage protein [Haliea sp. E1-2-M8]MDO8860157.1 3-keto-5-aminohexanoate cleavage protein [Haliea sp. E1-2-M8]